MINNVAFLYVVVRSRTVYNKAMEIDSIALLFRRGLSEQTKKVNNEINY